MAYESDVVLGEKYRDDQTGMEGIATVIAFFQHACERVTLEWVDNKDIKEMTFDSPRLTRVSNEEKVESEKTGGPDRGNAHIRPTITQR